MSARDEARAHISSVKERGAWLKRRARELRAEMTPHEKIVWRLLHQGELSALNWRKQSPLGEYILDFVSYPAKLVVEIDGAQHADAEIAASDAARTHWLKQQGYAVIRFWNFESVREQEGVWWAIHAAASQTKAAARMARWREANLHDIAKANDRLPLDGGGVAEGDGGGAPPMPKAEALMETPPQSSLRSDSSPIEGEQ